MNRSNAREIFRSDENSLMQKTLTHIRRSLGFKSARAFFDQYLSARTRLDFNYSYYMKIEGGKIVPSAQIISNICGALEEEAAQELMLSYCEVIFPERAGVFQKARGYTKKIARQSNEESQKAPQITSGHQTFLTQAQVACIGRSKNYYFAFLLLTLARRPIDISELKTSIPHMGREDVGLLMDDFVKAKLIKIQGGQISSIATEMRFPESDSPALKKMYEQMDAWTLAFNKEMNFDAVTQKMMLRRVSSRYFALIQSHTNLLIDLIRASDELESEQNDEVLMFNVSIQRGRLPG